MYAKEERDESKIYLFSFLHSSLTEFKTLNLTEFKTLSKVPVINQKKVRFTSSHHASYTRGNTCYNG